MLLHLSPRLYGPAESVLVDFHLEPFDLLLRGGADLATRRPYPNKRFKVGCRRKGNRAINGVLIETPNAVTEFTSRARWAVGAEYLLEHTVTYRVIDSDFDFASDDPLLWYGVYGTVFKDRRTPLAKELPPMITRPTMEFQADRERPNTRDMITTDNIVLSREQKIDIPTLERDRLKIDVRERFPDVADAFRVS